MVRMGIIAIIMIKVGPISINIKNIDKNYALKSAKILVHETS